MKKIKGYENYLIDEAGNVYNKSGKILRSHINRLGYPMVSVSKKGKQKLCTVHRLIALAFIPNPNNKPFVNHINGIKHDNRIENLEWVTASENRIHSIRIGTSKIIKGTKTYHSLFTEAQVKKMRSIRNINYHEQARVYDCDASVVWNIVNRKTYKDVV